MTPTNAEKRKEHDETEERGYHQVESKRQKTSEIDHRGAATILGSIKDVVATPLTKNDYQDINAESTTIGANELASAFALASLATALSPKTVTTTTNTEAGYESRDADNDTTASLENGTIETDGAAVPISPDVRSPIRSTKQLLPQHPHRRVTFSDDTKNTSRLTSRRLSLPPRSVNARSLSSSSSMVKTPTPAGVSRSSSMPPNFATARRDHFLMQQQQQMQYSPSRQRFSPSHQHQMWVAARQQQQHNQNQNNNTRQSNLFLPPLQHQNRYHTQNPTMSTVGSPTSERHSNNNSNKWICDFCNAASFDTYEEACAHESGCRVRCMNRPKPTWSPYHQQPMHFGGSGARSNGNPGAPPPQQPYLPHLSAGVPAIGAAGGGHIPPPPPTLPIRMRYNKNSVKDSPSVTEYKTISPSMSPATGGAERVGYSGSISTQGSVEMTESSLEGGESYTLSPRDYNDETQHHDHEAQQSPPSSGHLKEGDSIVLLEDMEMVPPYVYFLMSQVESTHFTEADRFVARSKGPVGFSGFQCCHCHGHAGLGKYFPVTAKSLSTNSTSQNIHSHLLKCRKVAPYIKEQLITLKDEKSKAPRLEPGWRRIFFEKIWSRLHGNS